MLIESAAPENSAPRVAASLVGCSPAHALGTLGCLPEQLLCDGVLPHVRRRADFFAFAHASRDARRLCLQYSERVMRQEIDARLAGIGAPGPVVRPMRGEGAAASKTVLLWL